MNEITDDVKKTYLDRHPTAKHWIEFSDFSFFQLHVSHVYYVGGFGVMGWVEAGDYASAGADPLAEASAGIIEHMNRDHGEALRELARHFSGLPAEEATMVACDRLGIVVRVRTAEGMKGARIAFPQEVRSAEEARKVLVAMTREARKG